MPHVVPEDPHPVRARLRRLREEPKVAVSKVKAELAIQTRPWHANHPANKCLAQHPSVPALDAGPTSTRQINDRGAQAHTHNVWSGAKNAHLPLRNGQMYTLALAKEAKPISLQAQVHAHVHLRKCRSVKTPIKDGHGSKPQAPRSLCSGSLWAGTGLPKETWSISGGVEPESLPL